MLIFVDLRLIGLLLCCCFVWRRKRVVCFGIVATAIFGIKMVIFSFFLSFFSSDIESINES